MNNKQSKNAGFSLIELIAVIAVMVVLAAVAVPLYGSYTDSAKEAADVTYINECYRAAAVVVAEDGDFLRSVAVTTSGEVLVSHNYYGGDGDDNVAVKEVIDLTGSEAADKYVFCGGCSTSIVAIIGGMQELQSSSLKSATNGDTYETPLGTVTYVEGLRIGSSNTSDEGAWVFEPVGTKATWSSN